MRALRLLGSLPARAGLVLPLLLGAGSAGAETLVFEPSTKRVEITSNFSGTTLTVYGTVERDATTVGRGGGYDVAVMLVGPSRSVVTRRKDRLVGIWVNRDSRTYVAPSFYAVATTKPIAEMAPVSTLKAAQVGLDALILPETVPGGVEVLAGTVAFRDAYLRLQRRDGLYREYPGGVRRLGQNLWAATLPIPAEVPVGRYKVRTVLFGDGSALAEQVSEIEVVKTGFEQQVADLAAHWSATYGLLSVFIALFTGWLGGVLFRRD
ncbi:TIGR02186 family protein [Pinisolibacter aquiterrae]|uniref:TIGR02186 family protein n=1 Tax=Pinisolibacter aquiterrae TaxID=2815579 RepID=UPI001C3DFD76|nr:TIGR02186 family protein [Pinisolibacter aquiterrae]MBV5266785.1 TIGR02186 family protein [Pinisolibacter aquiterrae]MCC8234902.1 TIGR02186 family protein [Pinisolibacter aquiterrae]